MSCPNCEIFHNRCQSSCCGPVPINRKVFADNMEKTQRRVVSVMNLGQDVIPETEDMTCVFLSPEFKCMIYDSRPEVCKKYGDESHILMTCSFQKATGEARSRTERRNISREQEKHIKARR